MNEDQFKELIATIQGLGVADADTRLGGMELIAREIKELNETMDAILRQLTDILEKLK